MKTPAEYQRDYRERKRKAQIVKAAPSRAVFTTPFFRFFQEHENGLGDFGMQFDAMGIPMPEFVDDGGPKSMLGAIEEYDHYKGYERSIGRAEIMVSSLIDAASALARMVADYKRSEITVRIAELQAADLSDPDAKTQAFAEMSRLTKMLDQLDKQVRWTFPQWKVTGE